MHFSRLMSIIKDLLTNLLNLILGCNSASA